MVFHTRLSAIFAAGAMAIVLAAPIAAQDCVLQQSDAVPVSAVMQLLASDQSGLQAQDCAMGTTQQGNVFCQWAFALKTPLATSAFEALHADLTTCAEQGGMIKRDVGVNHPDAYVAYIYETDRRRITLAYKDKSGLDATYVTIRVFEAP